jgi:hypothetical protein
MAARVGWFGGGTERTWITFRGSEFPTSGANSPDPAQDSQASDRIRPLVETRAAFSQPSCGVMLAARVRKEAPTTEPLKCGMENTI